MGMRCFKKAMGLTIVLMVSFLLQSAWSSGILSHNIVKVDLTCRFEDGRMIMTTKPDLADDAVKENPFLFIPMKRYEPFEIEAGSAMEKTSPQLLLEQGFEGELTRQLKKIVVGMVPGEKRSVTLQASIPEGLPENERYMVLSRVLRRNLFYDLRRTEFEEVVGTPPGKGMIIDFSEDMKAAVQSWDANTVKIKLNIEEGKHTSTPWGPGVFKIMDSETYGILLDLKVGDIVRTMHLVGCVSKVEADAFVIDYGNPFGGRPLLCDIEIRSIRDAVVSEQGKDGIL